MRTTSFAACVAVLFSVLVPAFAGDEVQVRSQGDGRYVLTITLQATADPAQGQRAVEPKAEQLCGNLHPQYGHYEYEALAPAKSTGTAAPPAQLRYAQEIQCLPTPEQSMDPMPSTVPPAPATPPTAADADLIKRRTIEYLQAKIAGDANAAYAPLSKEMRSYASAEEWTSARNAFKAKAGDGAVADVVRLSWYDNPANAPTPGRYVAADYRVDYPSGAFTCGYVAWLLQGDGRYLIVREEEGLMTPDMLIELTPEQRATMRTQLQCRD